MEVIVEVALLGSQASGVEIHLWLWKWWLPIAPGVHSERVNSYSMVSIQRNVPIEEYLKLNCQFDTFVIVQANQPMWPLSIE